MLQQSVVLVSSSLLSLRCSLHLVLFIDGICMQIRFNNVPRAQSLAEKSGENWVKHDKDKLLFPGGDTQFARGAHRYLDHIGEVSDWRSSLWLFSS